MLSLSLNRRILIVLALSLGLISLVRAIPVRAETIEIEEGNGLVISGEFTSTAGAVIETPGEGNFTTPATPVDQPTIVPEETFQTLSTTTSLELVSAENTFTTLAEGGGGGNDDDNGGGGGGGGRSRKKTVVTTATLVSAVGSCQPYLLKFIRFGVANDPNEVRKLQSFLRDFVDLDVPVDGFYGESTFEAVKIFQLRYTKDVLKPWGISYATGYVYITTTLAINNLYCERSTATTLDLRSRLTTPPPAFIEVLPATTTPTSTPFLEIGEATSTNGFMLATLGVFNFFKQISCWWWILVLLCIILYLLFELRNERQRNRDQHNVGDRSLTS